ncbi:hypothetical protein H0H87_002662 [Tephrocybe sp. NHM501043]|nr:hypothetical protein H0H87_002662 [Tephrocybe sp. NHM501043]
MNTSVNPASPQGPPDKGKGRAQGPTERTPLLLEQSSSNILPLDDHAAAISREQSHHQLRTRLTIVFLISLSFCIVFVVFLALLAWSYAARVSQLSPDDVVRDGLVLQGPDHVDVLNITSSGEIWLVVDARLGMDAGGIVGVNSEPGDTVVSDLWKAFGRWGITKLDRVTVALSTIEITSRSHPSAVLASVVASPMVVPLTANPPADSSWLTPISNMIVIRPSNDTFTWIKFLRESWSHGSIDVQVKVMQADVRGGKEGARDWRNWLHQKLVDVRTSIHFQIPSIPGLPPPGHKDPFPSIQDLVTLKSFYVSSNFNHLDIRASATAINPTPPNFNMTSPSLPFIVSLPYPNSSHASIPVAAVSTAPFALTHPNITLDISGTALPLASDTAPVLSSFLSRYLSKQPNSIIISCPLIANLTVQTIFPSPDPPPRILHDVTIRDMKVKPGTTFLASGTIFARIIMPAGIDVDLVVSRVLPDVLVFDGEVPDTVQFPPPQPSLPDPLPEGAFGHIRPEDWLKAHSARDTSEKNEGAAYAVTAKIVDVPLQVLPGRQKEFSNFVSKVVFGSEGAIAGILGTAAVAARVRGLPLSGHDGEMELAGLPFRGSVRVGKKGTFAHFEAFAAHL